MSRKPVHLHDEQFDGHMHAACYTLDADKGSVRIVCEDEFESAPKNRRCRKCARIWWPHGCEPSGKKQ